MIKSFLQSNPLEGSIIIVGVLPDQQLTGHHDMAQELIDAVKSLNIQEHEAVYVGHVLLVNMGNPQTITDWKKVGARCFQRISHHKKVSFLLDKVAPEHVRAFVYGFQMRTWRFDTYHTSHRPLPQRKCEEVGIVTTHGDKLSAQIKEDEFLIDSVHWARQLANEPGNIITPETFVQRLESLKELGIKIDVLDEVQLKEKKFGALLGVGQGSANPSRVAVLSWDGGSQGDDPLVFVGKGVTFDSGGLSIKPSSGMEDMKLDKTGAVVAAAVIRSLAARKAKVNARAVLALVENMTSGTAQRPGDIVTSLSGQTIEVLDTDAEGRLILADALWYAQQRWTCKVLVDIATLTGAARIALGSEYAALFSDDDELVEQLIHSGGDTGEPLWRLPLHEGYDKSLNSDCADMKNIGTRGVGAGSSVAAQFLKRFVKKRY
jgi:leucyl aminopeptidase